MINILSVHKQGMFLYKFMRSELLMFVFCKCTSNIEKKTIVEKPEIFRLTESLFGKFSSLAQLIQPLSKFV